MKEIVYESHARLVLDYDESHCVLSEDLCSFKIDHDYYDMFGFFEEFKNLVKTCSKKYRLISHLSGHLKDKVSQIDVDLCQDINSMITCHTTCLVSDDFNSEDCEELKRFIGSQLRELNTKIDTDDKNVFVREQDNGTVIYGHGQIWCFGMNNSDYLWLIKQVSISEVE